MRLWLRDSERKPDPEPVKTDDRTAIAVGTGVWIVLLAIVVALRPQLEAIGAAWWLWACVIGVGRGAVGLLVFRRRRS